MSSKLLYTFKDEDPNLYKQIGCMNGFFQIFGRHQFLTGQKGQKKIPSIPGQRGNHGVEPSSALQKASLQGRSVKKVAKEKQRASTESSRTSFSSSSCSSSFSSLECNRVAQPEPSSHGLSKLSKSQPNNLQDVVKDSVYRETSVLSVKTVTKEDAQNHIFKHVDSPRPLQKDGSRLLRTRDSREGSRPLTRDAPRFSFDGRVSRDASKSLKIKELPRLSLDSKQSTMRATTCEMKSSVVTKLMGLEAFPGNISSKNQTGLINSSPKKEVQSISRSARASDESKRNHMSGSPQRSHKDSISPRMRNTDSVTKSNPSSKIPVEPAPWRQGSQVQGLKANRKMSNLSASAYGEVEKGLADTEFKKSGKDLRALRRTLDQEPAQRGHPCSLHSADIRAQTSRSMQTIKVSVHTTRENTTSSGKSSGNKGPSLQKKNGHEKQSCMTSKSCDSNVTRRQLSRQVTESGSPRTKQKHKLPNSEKRNNQMKDTSSNIRDLRKHGNAICKQFESIETEATSTNGSDRNNRTVFQHYGQKQKNLEFKLKANRAVAEPAGVSLEQPSPISVLNAIFYRDESPSPVKKVINIVKDNEACNSDKAEWTSLNLNQPWTSISNLRFQSDENKSDNIQHLVSHMGQDESINYIAVLPEDSNPEHRYIYKILLASGLLRDLDSSMTAVPFHPSSSPINPKVFLAIEQSIASISLSNDEHLSRNISHEKSVREIQRKLIFDAVNETLGHKLVPDGCSKQWFSPNNKAGTRLKGQQLLRELCSEIDQLQANKSSCRLGDEDGSLTSLLWGDLMPQSTEWSDHPIETSRLVVDIDSLIFRDLINEVVNGETARLQTCSGGYRRQLFY